MKRIILAAAIAVAALSGGQTASAAGNPFRIGLQLGCCNYGLSFGFDHRCGGPCGSGGCGGGGCGPAGCGGGGGYAAAQAAPWYLYWPYENHFQTPAPVGYPYWPSQTTGGAEYGQAPYGAGAYGYANHGGAPAYPGVTPVNYTGGMPNYWYGR